MGFFLALLLFWAPPSRAADSSLAWDAQRVRGDLEGEIQARILDPILGRGRAVVFVELESKQPKHILVTVLHDESVGAEQLRLVRKAVVEAYPGWSLDGGSVAFRPTRFSSAREGSGFPALPLSLLGAAGLALAWLARRRPAAAAPRPSAPPAAPQARGGFSPRPLAAPALVAFAFGATIWYAEGLAGFRPFFNLEALLLVVIGTLGIVGASHPVGSFLKAAWRSMSEGPAGEDRWRSAEVLALGAKAAVTSGLAGTALGMILMLSSIDDVAMVPRRMALAMTSGMFGLFLSEFVLAPMARRCGGPARGPGDGAAARQGLGAIGVGLSALALFVILYALSAAVSR